MKKTFTLLLLTAALMQAATVQAQDLPCGTTQRLMELYSKYPQLKADHEAFIRNCFDQRQSGLRGDSTTVYIVPLVFHVLHEYGNENVSDAQVRDAVRVLNEDFRKLNADTIQIVPAFTGLASDVRIEFRLATLDPQGNCTNGINHYYSHETVNGDDFSKFVQWPRAKYLNVWVSTNTIPGAAAYTYQPTDVAALPMAAFDGIVIMHDYLGTTGTAASGRQHTLTHEVGHWLSLAHVWGSGPVNVTCGDDGIPDTPETAGHETCTAADLSDDSCTPGVIENTQNYMDYSYCNRMFTHDQTYAMRTAIQSSISNRSNLWSATNHTATGIDVTPAPVCTPVPDMHTAGNIRYICPGDNVTFIDVSWRAEVDSRVWSFPGGTPSTSTLANPTVTYNTPGWHDVVLTVTNAAGTETKTFVQAIHVSNPWADYVGPRTESFEAAGPSGIWIVENPEGNEAHWHRVNTAAATGSYAFMLNNHKDPDIFSPFYFNQLGGNHDALISPSFDLSNTSTATLTFKYSCASHATSPLDQTEMLRVYSSVNCGRSWVQRATLSGAELANGGTSTGNYVPSAGMWTTKTINLPVALMQDNVRFKFEYTASDFSNNIYLDDINVNGILGQPEPGAPEYELSVYPNPSGSQDVTVVFTGNNQEVQLVVSDIVGKTVYRAHLPAASNKISHTITGGLLSSGMYTVTVGNGSLAQSVKLVVQE